MKHRQKGISAVIIIFIVGFVGFIIILSWFVLGKDKNKENKSTSTTSANQQSKAQDFGANNTDYGVFRADGYGTIVKQKGATCEEGPCQEYNYAFFNITKTSNTKLLDYLQMQGASPFFQERAIGIGCEDNGHISYMNSSDTKGTHTYSFSDEDATTIMNATAENPVTVEIERLQDSRGNIKSSKCYSYFSTFKIVR